MTVRFIQITDTHYGVTTEFYNTKNYHLQEGHPEQLPVILKALSQYIQQHQVDFVIHSGDMINAYTPDTISEAYTLFSTLPVPLYLCLGNHDIWHVQGAAAARADWLRLAPDFFKGDVNFTLKFDQAHIHVLPNQWGNDNYEWTNDQTANFKQEQRQYIETQLAEAAEKTHVIITHAQVQAISEEQRGSGNGAHSPVPDFKRYFEELKTRYPHLKLVMNGHTHHNMYLHQAGCHYVSCASFSEAPFDFKVVSIDEAGLALETVSLGQQLGFPWSYNEAASHVQGRPRDRAFVDRK